MRQPARHCPRPSDRFCRWYRARRGPRTAVNASQAALPHLLAGGDGRIAAGASPAEKQWLFSGTARKVYRLS